MSSPIDLDFDNDLNSTVVDPNEPVAPTTGVYGGLFQPLFGTLTAEDQQEIWIQFLKSNSLSLTNPPPVDAQTQAKFTTYAVGRIYSSLENSVTTKVL